MEALYLQLAALIPYELRVARAETLQSKGQALNDKDMIMKDATLIMAFQEQIERNRMATMFTIIHQ